MGIPGANIDEWTSGMTQIDITGFSNPVIGFAASLPWDRSERTVQFTGVVTKIAGNHTIKYVSLDNSTAQAGQWTAVENS